MLLQENYEYLHWIEISYINKLIADKDNFSEIKFQNWLTTNKIEEKRNPSAYIHKAFPAELEKGTFDSNIIEVVQIDTESVFRDMRSKKIALTQGDTNAISETIDYLVNTGILTIEEMGELNSKIIDYISKHSRKASDYVALIKKSKSLKDKVNWKELDLIIEKSWKEYLAMLASLREIPN